MRGYLKYIVRVLDLEPLFNRHEKSVFGFSGGKDSLDCLDPCRD